jgi:hypothetical protein
MPHVHCVYLALDYTLQINGRMWGVQDAGYVLLHSYTAYTPTGLFHRWREAFA